MFGLFGPVTVPNANAGAKAVCRQACLHAAETIKEITMSKQRMIVWAIGALALMAGAPLQAADTGAATPPAQQKQTARDRIYGSQLMTPQERDDYRAKMRAAKTQQERDQIRAEHHKEMQARAKETGITLPDEPIPRGGRRMGRGIGAGQGMGPCAGQGPCGGAGPTQ